jgi:hypothetical protein
MFHMRVAKVNRDVAYVVMVVYVCCKFLFLMFYMFFLILQDVAYVSHIMFASVLSECCVCFCNGFKCFSGVFANVSYECFKCFICL